MNPQSSTMQIDKDLEACRALQALEDTLPDKPSEILYLAMEDLKQVLKNNIAEVNMCSWLTKGDSKCTVCLAGAVMLQEFPVKGQLDVLKEISPSNFKSSIRNKLNFLNAIRVGEAYVALDYYPSINNIDSKTLDEIEDEIARIPRHKTNTVCGVAEKHFEYWNKIVETLKKYNL